MSSPSKPRGQDRVDADRRGRAARARAAARRGTRPPRRRRRRGGPSTRTDSTSSGSAIAIRTSSRDREVRRQLRAERLQPVEVDVVDLGVDRDRRLAERHVPQLAVEQLLDRLALGEPGEAAHRGHREARQPRPLDVEVVLRLPVERLVDHLLCGQARRPSSIPTAPSPSRPRSPAARCPPPRARAPRRTAATHAPLPPDSSSPTCLLRSDGIGRALKRREDLASAPSAGRSTSGSGSSARRAVRSGVEVGGEALAERAHVVEARELLLQVEGVERVEGRGHRDSGLGWPRAAPLGYAARLGRPRDDSSSALRAARPRDRRGDARQRPRPPSTTSTRDGRCCAPAASAPPGELVAAEARAAGRRRRRRPDAGRRPDRLLGARAPADRAEGLLRAQGAQGARPPALDRGPGDRARRARAGGRGRRHLGRLAGDRDRAAARGGRRARGRARGAWTGSPAAREAIEAALGDGRPLRRRCSRSTTSTRTARTAPAAPKNS